jgi:hypothetical protein
MSARVVGRSSLNQDFRLTAEKLELPGGAVLFVLSLKKEKGNKVCCPGNPPVKPVVIH